MFLGSIPIVKRHLTFQNLVDLPIFFVDDFKETDSNISWRASDIKIYPETNGDISGIIGRYSGQLVVNFDRYDDGKRQSLVFNCKKFEPIEKKF